MKRFFVIGFLWLGLVGSAMAGPATYDYVPEPFGIDFSTAPKPHMDAPGGEWHVISGDGTIYPDIINYCDPDKDPKCFGHLFVACQAWAIFKPTKKGGYHLPPICEEVAVNRYLIPEIVMFMFDARGDIRKTALFYYKLDIWKMNEMLYHWQKSCELPPIEEIPFKKDDRWESESAIDIYYGYCKPHDECLTNGGKGDLPLTEADKNCPVTNCQRYGFEKLEDINRLNSFARPQASVVFPLSQFEDGSKFYHVNYSRIYLGGSFVGCVDRYPARWLPGHPLSEYNERNKETQ